MKEKSALVIFSSLPEKEREWWGQFSTVIAPQELEEAVRAKDVSFEALELWTDPPRIQEAAIFLGDLARAVLPDGTRVSKSVVYRGYELWWMQYDELYYQLCLPYSQYKRLLCHLAEFPKVYLYQTPAPALFQKYLQAYECVARFNEKKKTFPSFGIWLQIFLSFVSIPVLVLTRPKTLVYTGDLFDPPHDHSFRMRYIYEELRARKLPFVEFIRSLEPGKIVLAHFWKRRRPVVYSFAIKVVLSWCASFFSERTFDFRGADPEQKFRLSLATMYLCNVRGIIWSTTVLNWLVRMIGIKTALIPAASSRTYCELLACKLAGVPSIGILHGAASKYYNVYDFMPEYDGSKHLGVDVYGVWSSWWRDYYLANGKLYQAEHLAVSGPMRPSPVGETFTHSHKGTVPSSGPIKVLFVPGELSVPEQIVTYIRAMLDSKDISLYLTFRPYRDAFENWIQGNDPELLEKIGPDRIFRGRRIQEDIAACDVVVGSYSTAVLEALLQLKPFIFFHTEKWGDYFDLKAYQDAAFFVGSPGELVERIKEIKDIPEKTLKELQNRFFGDPYKNGSAWAIDEVEKHL